MKFAVRYGTATVIVGLVLMMTSVWAEEGYEEPELSELDRQHWSFQPLAATPPARLPEDRWSRNPIDRFVQRRLREVGLRPSPEAPRATLIRRLYLDLVGLPPTPEQLQRSLQDPAADGYERLVGQLLASPQYGPRWAQFWLDLARFAETDGFEHDKVRPQAWKYRDWVIDAFNDDMPYDQFVRWQIAGDLLAPHNADARIATSFCLSGPDMPDINLQEERKHVLLNEMAATVGATFLGLQVGCAQCHDHMYDPVSQADFYRLRAFFASAVRVERNKSVSVLQAQSPKATGPSHLMIRGDFRRPGPQLEAGFLRVVDSEQVSQDQPLSRVDLARWLTRQDQPLTARVIVNRIWQFHFGRGLSHTPSDFGVMGDVPSHPDLLDWLAREFVDSGWQLKRLHWLIVTSATYRQWGEQPQDPAHQNDWQAVLDQDPECQLLSRFPRRRLEAEVIRDAMYAVSGSLNDKMRGPGVRPPLPREMVATLLKNQWTTTQQRSEHYRRSVYVFARRNLRFPILAMFDRPSANSSCAVRRPSTTAPQSLFMLNSAAALDAARRLAGTVWREAGSDQTAQVRRAVVRALGRSISDEEESMLVAFLQTQRSLGNNEATSLALPIPRPESAEATAAAALTDLCLALLNSNEFLYLD